MPEYQYTCLSCKNVFTTLSRTDIPPCPVCKQPSKRDYVFQARNSTPEHFNVSAGQYVSNDRELRDAFKRQSDEQSERLGIEHNLVPLTRAEMRDPTVHGVTEEGLDSQSKAHSEALS